MGSGEPGYAAEEHPMLDCQWRVPSCQDYSTDWADDDEGTIRFEDILSYDFQMSAAVSLKRNDDGVTSTMTIQLTDTRTGDVSPISSYIVRKDEVVEGGVFNFKASNGKRYSIACEGSRLAEGIPYGMMPCDPPRSKRSQGKHRRSNHSRSSLTVVVPAAAKPSSWAAR